MSSRSVFRVILSNQRGGGQFVFVATVFIFLLLFSILKSLMRGTSKIPLETVKQAANITYSYNVLAGLLLICLNTVLRCELFEFCVSFSVAWNFAVSVGDGLSLTMECRFRKQTRFNTGCWTSSVLFLCAFSLLPSSQSRLLAFSAFMTFFKGYDSVGLRGKEGLLSLQRVRWRLKITALTSSHSTFHIWRVLNLFHRWLWAFFFFSYHLAMTHELDILPWEMSIIDCDFEAIFKAWLYKMKDGLATCVSNLSNRK